MSVYLLLETLSNKRTGGWVGRGLSLPSKELNPQAGRSATRIFREACCVVSTESIRVVTVPYSAVGSNCAEKPLH